MALLWLVYQTFNVVFKATSVVKYKALTSIQLFGFTWFIVTFINALNTDSQRISGIFSFAGQYSSNEFINKLFPLLSILYLFFFLVFAVKFLIQFFSTTNKTKQYQIYTSAKWNEFVNTVSSQLNISKKIVLKTTANNVVPFTIGFLKPIIVVPLAAINNLSAQQLEAILIHEIAHIKRQDYFINLLLMLIDTVMCFNPFSKLINNEIFIERELCCDDVVINYPYSTNQYAQALLNIAKTQTTPQLYAGSLGAINTQQQLKYRINRMFNIETKVNNHYTKLQVAFALFFGIAIFGLVGFIDNSVKNIVSNSAIINNENQTNFKPIVFRNTTTNDVSNEQLVSTHHTAKKNLHKQNSTAIANNNVNSNTLQLKREFVEQGFKDLAKAIVKNDNYTVNNNDINAVVDTLNNAQNIEILPAVKKQSNVVVERFLVPATSQSAASIIVVTTTVKEDGSKQVKIEIEKGSSRIE